MRKELRAKRKIERDKVRKKFANCSYNQVFTYKHFLKSFAKSLKGVSWKPSVQRYYLKALTKLYIDYILLKRRKLPPIMSGKKKVITERGKKRIIIPIHIKDRIIQKVLCDYALVPVIKPRLIYDNGASLKGKGTNFTRKRVLFLLRKAIKTIGTNFYVMQFDFKDFFNSVPHRTCRQLLEKYIKDKDIVNLTMEIIKSTHYAQIKMIKDKNKRNIQLQKLKNDELNGMCLGSQVSQIMALLIANDIDHYIKDQMKNKYYVRYMDDGILFAQTKEELYKIYDGINEICQKLGLELNIKKTRITKISKGFTFLKIKYNVSHSGKVIKRLHHQGIVVMRRKLKKFKLKIDSGNMSINDAYVSMQSWLDHAKLADSKKTIKNMLILYQDLFGSYKGG